MGNNGEVLGLLSLGSQRARITRLPERDLAIGKRLITSSRKGAYILTEWLPFGKFHLDAVYQAAIFQGPCNRRSKEYALNRPSGFEEAPKKVRSESRVMGDYLVRFGEHLSSPDRLTGVNLGPYRVDS